MVGSWWGPEDGGGWTGSTRSSSPTGSGPASQPRNPRAASWLDTTPGTTTMTGPGGGQTNPLSSFVNQQANFAPTQYAAATQQREGTNPLSSFITQQANFGRTASNQLAQQAVGAPNALGGVRSILDSFYGPQSSLYEGQLKALFGELNPGTSSIYANKDLQTRVLERDTDLSRRGLDLDRAGVGLDRKALGVDTDLTKGQLGNLERLVGILGKQYGLEGESYSTILSQLGIDEAKLKDMAGRQKFDLRSNLTARGAFNTVANERGSGRIDRDLIYGLGGIGNQRRQADIAHRGNVLGLDEKGIGYDNQRLGLNARLANIGVDTGRLDLALQRIGLSEEGLDNALQDGLDAIGLGAMTSIDDVMRMIGDTTNGAGATLARTILEEVARASNLPPEVLAELMAALGIAPSATPTAPTGSADPTRNL